MPRYAIICLFVLGAALVATPAYPCSRYLSNNIKLGVFAARTMDWPGTTEPTLWVFPRGVMRDGGKLGDEVVVKENAVKWTSKYSSMVTSIWNLGAADGVNEKGLAGHMLHFTPADFGERDVNKPGVNAVILLQYMLDNAADVKEALQLLKDIQPVMCKARGEKATVHWAIEDASGDSAIIEYVKGKVEIHHSKDYRVMTNEPAYGEQLRLLKEQDFSKPSSDTPLPGNVRSVHRFQRASYFGAVLPEPKNEREAIANVLSVIRNVSVPFGAPYGGFGVYNTEYRTAINVTKGRYFFELTTSPNVMWADLTKFKLDAGSPVMSLNPDDIELSGDVSGKFKKVDKSPF
ncbi:MAG: linear amide C-N hydrolase [Pirellulales bacterium]|nr:linear amide C-N hydrolase [Pirellulales bacterium]